MACMGTTPKTHKELTYDTSIGQRAQVHRETVNGGEAYERANAKLKDIGESLKPREVLEYLGSAAVHVYKSPVLDELFIISQAGTMQDCPELIASSAITDLTGSLMQMYGRKRRVKRSGF